MFGPVCTMYTMTDVQPSNSVQSVLEASLRSSNNKKHK